MPVLCARQFDGSFRHCCMALGINLPSRSSGRMMCTVYSWIVISQSSVNRCRGSYDTMKQESRGGLPSLPPLGLKDSSDLVAEVAIVFHSFGAKWAGQDHPLDPLHGTSSTLHVDVGLGRLDESAGATGFGGHEAVVSYPAWLMLSSMTWPTKRIHTQIQYSDIASEECL